MTPVIPIAMRNGQPYENTLVLLLKFQVEMMALAALVAAIWFTGAGLYSSWVNRVAIAPRATVFYYRVAPYGGKFERARLVALANASEAFCLSSDK